MDEDLLYSGEHTILLSLPSVFGACPIFATGFYTDLFARLESKGDHKYTPFAIRLGAFARKPLTQFSVYSDAIQVLMKG